MSKAATAWAALQDALATQTPRCEGDDRFISDEPDTHALWTICQACPVQAACGDYARAAPRAGIAGYWAGYARGPRT